MSVTASPVHQMLEAISSPGVHASSGHSSPHKVKVESEVSSPVNRPSWQVVGDGSVTLRGRPCNKVKTGGWRSAAFFYVLTLSDTVSVIGLAANLATYLVYWLHILDPDEVATTLTNYMGVTYLLPLLWGFLADAYLGKYVTICLSSTIVLAGAILLTVQSATPSLLPPYCPPAQLGVCGVPASKGVMHLFLAGLYLMSLGSAGVKPCMASMGQEQFEEGDAEEGKQRAHFFTGFYVSINLGAVLTVTLLTWVITDHTWKWGFGVVTAFVVIGVSSFLLGTPLYRHQKPAGSPLTRLAQPLVAAFRNSKQHPRPESSDLYELGPKDLALRAIRRVSHTSRLRWLDWAAVKEGGAEEFQGDASPWKLCSVTQVENLKAVLNILPIWVTNFLVYTLFAQITGFTVQQALTLDRQVGRFVIPAPSFTIFLMIGALVSVAVWEWALVPVARRFTGRAAGLSDLQRTGVGLAASAASMVVAALVEARRVDVIKSHGMSYTDILQGVAVPMSVFYLLPQYMILGFVEFVVGVAQLNFFAREIPDGMRGLGTSLYFSAVGLGYFFSSLLVNLVNFVTERAPASGWLQQQGIMDGGLAKFYWLLAAMVTANTLLYVLFASLFVPKQLEPAPVGEAAAA